jgi:hypothetical protein
VRVVQPRPTGNSCATFSSAANGADRRPSRHGPR